MTQDFNLRQMHRLISKHQGFPAHPEKIAIVYVTVFSDYWQNQQQFVQDFCAAPLDHDIVIHVKFEALSLTNSGIVATVQKLIIQTGRNPNSVFVFSPNSVQQDAPWPNIYWQQFPVTDEIIRAEMYMVQPKTVISRPKTWAVFVGRKSMPRLRALYDCWQHPRLQHQCVLSLMQDTPPETVYFWQQPDRFYDQIDDWFSHDEQQKFFQWYQQCPVKSVDNYSVQDQYLDFGQGENRNSQPTLSLLNLQDRYLFEVVFETMTRGQTFTPSEKTVRAMVAHKPMVVYAPVGFLHNLKQLGFETFGDLWDESYDQLEGPSRYWAMREIIQSVAQLPFSARKELYYQAQARCQRNYQQLLNYQYACKPRTLLSHSPAAHSAG